MAGRKHRQKGDRVEREIVKLHTDLGVEAQRVPLSGAAGGRFSGDVDVFLFGSEVAPLVAEVKARKDGSGFVQLERWLGDNDALFLRRNLADPMIVLPWSTWVRILKALRRAP